MSIVTTTIAGVVHSGLIGLGEDETVRVNLVNLGGPDTHPRRVQTTFFDALGKMVKRSEVEIAPGQSSSMDVGFQEVEEMPRDVKVPRKQLRVELVGFNPQPDPPGLLATIELFATKSGATRFIGDPQLG
jgi:hypothetical protein